MLASITSLLEEACSLCLLPFSKESPALMLCTAQHICCQPCRINLQENSSKCPQCRQVIKDFRKVKPYQHYNRIFASRQIIQQLSDQTGPVDFTNEPPRYEAKINALQNMMITNAMILILDKNFQAANKIIIKLLDDSELPFYNKNKSYACCIPVDPATQSVLNKKGADVLKGLLWISQWYKSKQNFIQNNLPNTSENSEDNKQDQQKSVSLKALLILKQKLQKKPSSMKTIIQILKLYIYQPFDKYRCLPGQQSFLIKHCLSDEQQVRVLSEIGKLIFFASNDRFCRVKIILDEMLDDYEFQMYVNGLKNEIIVSRLQQSIAYYINKEDEVGLAKMSERLKKIPRIILAEHMLKMGKISRNSQSWSNLTIKYYPFPQKKEFTSDLNLEGDKTKVLRMHNQSIELKQERKNIVAEKVNNKFDFKDEMRLSKCQGSFREERLNSEFRKQSQFDNQQYELRY